jgi:predicted dehydrogenase
VGLGYWGPNLLRNLVECEGAEVIRICDLNEEVLATYLRRYPALKATTRFDAVLNDRDVDAVVIATPVSSHYELAQAALQAGKHVFVEKPLAASADQARELVRVAEAQGLLLMPGHTFLYSPPVVLIKELIDSGRLGDIYFVSTSRVNLGLHQPDVSVVWDLGPHDFSILRYWFGESPVRVSAISRACVIPGTPDVAFINVEYASGTIAQIELAWLAPSKLRRTAIVGSERMVVYDDTSSEPVRLFDSGATFRNPETFGEYQLSYRTGDIVSPHVEAREPLFEQMHDFIEAIVESGTPRSSAELGLEVISTIEAVDLSLAAGGASIAIADVATSA